jgi:hypothetical protein
LQYRIQHESIPLTEEKQILREIKQFEGTREKVIANAAMRAKIQDSMGQKEAIQDQVKVRELFLKYHVLEVCSFTNFTFCACMGVIFMYVTVIYFISVIVAYRR